MKQRTSSDNGQSELRFSGPQRKELGMAITLEANEDYRERFFAAGDKILAAQDTITSEDVTAMIGLPASRNAIGATMNAFAKHNKLRIRCFVTSRRDSRHAGRIAQWER